LRLVGPFVVQLPELGWGSFTGVGVPGTGLWKTRSRLV
jgi:hypothetical protein